MNVTNFILILAGVLLNATAQLLLKSGTNVLGALSITKYNAASLMASIIAQPFILAGLACYVFSVGIWIIALSRVEVSIAYPLLSIGYIVNAIAAWYLFGEILSMGKITGIGVIIVGVWLVSTS